MLLDLHAIMTLKSQNYSDRKKILVVARDVSNRRKLTFWRHLFGNVLPLDCGHGTMTVHVCQTDSTT